MFSSTYLVQCPAPPVCDKSRCQLVTDKNGCPFCSCEPVMHPPSTFIQPSTCCTLSWIPSLNKQAYEYSICLGLPPAPSHCPLLDVANCVDPCIIFKNRVGCQECVCPVPQPTSRTPSTSGVAPPFSPPGLQTPPDTPSRNRQPPSSPGSLRY